MQKKKKKSAYIDYDYEAAYQKSLTDLQEDNLKRMLEEGKVKSLYATKEIKSGNQLEIEIFPEFTKQQREQIPDEGKIEKRRQAQKNLNNRNSRKMCERLINANFGDGDIWATFTYTDENAPTDMKTAQRDMQNFIRRVNYQRKKRGLPNAQYIYATECSPKGRWHHHIVMDGKLDLDTTEKCWNLGRRNNVRRIAADENGLLGLSLYITKDKTNEQRQIGKYQKAWKSSRGLKKPIERKNHYKFKQRDVDDVVSGKATIAAKLSKWYSGYAFTQAEIRYNTFNGRFYIYARMRVTETETKSKSKGTGKNGNHKSGNIRR